MFDIDLGLNGRILELLLDGASADDLTNEVAAQRQRSGADDRTLDRLLEQSLRLRDRLVESTAREQEQKALYATANELSTRHDIESVLLSIVGRSRELLSADMSYLTLIDAERGETYVRKAVGHAVPDFEEIRLTIGTGLGGLVIARRAPVHTSDYRSDPRVAHEPGVGRVLAEEGLVAVLGVPMFRDGQVMGVLYAADRRPRTFAQRSIDLLGSLATHATIALDGAQLLEESLAHRDRLTRSSNARDELLSVVIGGGGVTRVAEVAAGLVEHPVLVADASGNVLVVCERPGTRGTGQDAAARLLRISDSDPRPDTRSLSPLRAVVEPAGERAWASEVTAGRNTHGMIAILTDENPSAMDSIVLEHAAVACALVWSAESAEAEAEKRFRSELLGDVLSARSDDPDRWKRRMGLLGMDPSTAYGIAVIDRDDSVGNISQLLVTAQRLGGLAGLHRGRPVIMLPETTARATAEIAAESATNSAKANIAGVAVAGLDGIAEGYEEACRTLAALASLGRHGETVTTADLGLVGLLARHATSDELVSFVDSVISPLGDSAISSTLVETLHAYFQCSGNVSAVAAKLFVHNNTVYQRIRRAESLLGISLTDRDAALQLQVALLLSRTGIHR